ncbi:MAG: hypothetical protein KAI53_05010 [Candidatus Aenigmarchaeota archaeon]|nr:hypothetical protein [Candidatus Aenigmarchaeota archaeon]
MSILNDIALKYSILPTHYKPEDINNVILEICGANPAKFHEMYDTASSILGADADRYLPWIIKQTCKTPWNYSHISNTLFEVKVAIDMAHLFNTQDVKINPDTTYIQYVVSVHDESPSNSKTRHATDIDVCFPNRCVEVCSSTSQILSKQTLLTSNAHSSKWDFLDDPKKITTKQRGKFMDTTNAYFVVPRQITFNPHNIRDVDDFYTHYNAIMRLKKIKDNLKNNGIAFEVYKTQQVWNGKKQMPKTLNITPKILKEFITRKNKRTNPLSLTDAITLLGGNPKEVLQID